MGILASVFYRLLVVTALMKTRMAADVEFENIAKL